MNNAQEVNMWQYNYTNPDNELYHYGVPGMKWGNHKYAKYEAKSEREKRKGNIESANRYKKMANAARELGQAGQNLKDTRNIKIKGHFISSKNIDPIRKQRDKLDSEKINLIEAQAKYKAAKSKNQSKAAKAEQKTYMNALYKMGQPGSIADRQSGKLGSELYDRISLKKGKNYANTILDKNRKRAIATVAASTVVAVGSAVLSAYFGRR